MSITYTWTVKSLSIKPNFDSLNNVVVKALWDCNGTDGINVVVRTGETSFNDPIAKTFTAYNSLTQAEVLSWIWESINKNTIEDSISAEITNLANPSIITPPLPWIA